MKNIPFNIEAEQSILGCMLLDNQMIPKVSDEIIVHDFYDVRNQIIFSSMKNLFNGSIIVDYTTLTSELQARNALVASGGMEYLKNILSCVFTTANIDSYITILKDASLKRSIIQAATAIVESGYDGSMNATDYIDYAEDKIFNLAKRRKAEDFTPISHVVDKVNELTLLNRTRTTAMTGLQTGFDNLDRLTLGLQNNNLIILAARPAMGKSAFAMNVAINVAKLNMSNNNPLSVAIFSLEMSQEQILQRICATSSGVHISKILSGKMSSQEMMFFEQTNNELKKLNVYFSDAPGVTIADIRARCRKQKQENGLGLVIIDYLQLISGSNSKLSRQEEVSDISRSLKLMARELEVPVIALSQLSRKVEERPDKRPMMSDLRESGSIEQDADLIFFLYRASYYNIPNSNPGETELIVGKNRAGASGHSLKYSFVGEYLQFIAIEDNDGGHSGD
ncbi:MAG: replicative DNA helicase [bacterium]